MKIIIETDTERVVLETFYIGKIPKKQQLPIDIKEVPIKKSTLINYEKAKEVILSQTGEFMFGDIRDTLKDMPKGSVGNALRFLYKHGRVQKVDTIRGKNRWKVVPEPNIGDITREDRKNIIATITS